MKRGRIVRVQAIMAAMNSSHSIEKLNDENYESWKLQMRSILICNELWAYASGAEVKTEANRIEWTKKDQKALAMIMLSISRGQLNYIKKAETSYAAWNSNGSKAPFEKQRCTNNCTE